MQIIHYPTEAAFRTRLQPLLDATHAFTNQLYQFLGFVHKGQHLTLVYK